MDKKFYRIGAGSQYFKFLFQTLTLSGLTCKEELYVNDDR
jgi:hypothetical protein